MEPQPVVDIRNLWFAYNSEPVLRDVNLAVGDKELTSLLGPNGGGKTTLLKLMLGLLHPDRGEIRILGVSPREARPRVGYTPQHTTFDPHFPITVGEVILMGLLGRSGFLGFSSRRDRSAAREALALVNLEGFEGRSFPELSGGQRQRVLIARALVSRPEILLMDEPTANLDVSAEEEFYSLMSDLSRRMSILIVSHDVAFVSERVDKVVCVHHTVAVHPTANLTGDVLRNLYGQDIRLVRHDHDCLQQCEQRKGDDPVS
jgi:zinc transport system ATP-binding protein